MVAMAIVVGAAMLLFGRRLFWVFVVGVGFLAGAALAMEVFRAEDQWLVLAAAVVGGAFGAALMYVAQKLAVGLAGFLAGAYLGHELAGALQGPGPEWVWFLAGGVIGMILLYALFNWALILLSSLGGAAVVADHAPLEHPWPLVLFVGLALLGIIVQTRQYRGKRRGRGD